MTTQAVTELYTGLSTGASDRKGRARNLTLATAPAFSWEVERVPGAEGRELRQQQAAAIKELIRWLRQANPANTRAG